VIILIVIGLISLLFLNFWLSDKIDNYLDKFNFYYGGDSDIIYIVLCVIETSIIIQILYSSCSK